MAVGTWPNWDLAEWGIEMTAMPPNTGPSAPPAVSDAVAPPPASTPVRVFSAIAGAVILLLIGSITIWLTLGALVGMAIAIRVQRARRGRATRRMSWLGAMAAAAVTLTAMMAFALSKAPPGTIGRLRDSLRTARDTTPVPLPPWLERIAGGEERVRASREMAKQLEKSPVLLWWVAAVSITVTSALFGLLVGSVAWVGAMLGARGLAGRWPLAGARAPPA